MTRLLHSRSRAGRLIRGRVRRTSASPLPSPATEVTGAYTGQGEKQAVVMRTQLQMPWLVSMQADPGVSSAVAHSASVVQAMQSPAPEEQKLAPPVVG